MKSTPRVDFIKGKIWAQNYYKLCAKLLSSFLGIKVQGRARGVNGFIKSTPLVLYKVLFYVDLQYGLTFLHLLVYTLNIFYTTTKKLQFFLFHIFTRFALH